MQLGQKFGSNAHSPVAVDKQSIPANIRQFFHHQGDNIVLTGYHVDSPVEFAREAAFKIYYWDDPEKEQILQALLAKRNELAQVCSYKTFAERAMLESLAQDPSTVRLFLGMLNFCVLSSWLNSIKPIKTVWLETYPRVSTDSAFWLYFFR